MGHPSTHRSQAVPAIGHRSGSQCPVVGVCPGLSGAAQSAQNKRSVSSPQHWQRWIRAADSITYVVIPDILQADATPGHE